MNEWEDRVSNLIENTLKYFKENKTLNSENCHQKCAEFWQQNISVKLTYWMLLHNKNDEWYIQWKTKREMQMRNETSDDDEWHWWQSQCVNQ